MKGIATSSTKAGRAVSTLRKSIRVICWHIRKPTTIKAVPVRHPWRWVSAVLIALIVANAIWSIATEAQLDWDTIGEYLFSPRIISGLWLTLLLTAIAMTMGVLLGIVLFGFVLLFFQGISELIKRVAVMMGLISDPYDSGGGHHAAAEAEAARLLAELKSEER